MRAWCTSCIPSRPSSPCVIPHHRACPRSTAPFRSVRTIPRTIPVRSSIPASRRSRSIPASIPFTASAISWKGSATRWASLRGNPLFLFGGPGLGKTHIAQAIGIAIKEKYPELVVLYVTGNEFKTQYMDAVNVRNKLTDFLAYYMKMDVLIVDDIQDLIGQGSQNAFFNIFNHLHQTGKQLIFTSDRAPVDLQNFEERLLSRFKWGLSAELTRPDYATRLAMLKARAFREGVAIDDKVLECLATRVKSNFRELEGALISLIAHATLTHREATIDLVQNITEKIVGTEKEGVTIDRVQSVVCEYFNITRDTLLSKSRKRQIVQARQIAMYLSRNLIDNCSLATIGAELGGKDHATVLHACTTVSDLMSTDKSFKQYITDISKMLVPVDK